MTYSQFGMDKSQSFHLCLDFTNPLPLMSGHFQTSRGVIFSGSKRISSGLVLCGSDLADMEFQIHCIETEAYGAVLRAFVAQSDVLSWGKEGLITDLRKELRVSDVEHREILGKINSDESIKSLREQLKSSYDQLLTARDSPSCDPSMGHVRRKKMKVGQNIVLSFPKSAPFAQPSPATVHSSLGVQLDKLSSSGPALSPQMNVAQTVGPVPPNKQAPNAKKVRGSLIVQTSKRGCVHSGLACVKPRADVIQICATDKVMCKAERVCRSENPDPAQVEKTKSILREHERSLMDAIGKLAHVSDGDDSPDQKLHQYSSEEGHWNGHGYHSALYRQFGQTRRYCCEVYRKDHAGRFGLPYIDIQDD